jgi:predicted DCC family thiol-disulfide oxidoreductase YuxK
VLRVTEGERAHPVLLYDGVCGLCNRTVQFVLKRDRSDAFRFAALQSALGRRILERHGANPSDLDTFYVVLDFDAALPIEAEQSETLLARSDAVSFVLCELGGVWRLLGRLFRLLPRTARDGMYNLVARRRYRIFGRYDACPLPSEKDRRWFLDV